MQDEYTVYYLVNNKILYDQLPYDKRYLFRSTSFFNQVREAKLLIKELSINICILNHGRTVFYSPFIKKTKKIFYIHATNKYVPFYKRYIYALLINFSYLFSDKVIHVTEYSKKEHIIAKNKAVKIYNGIDLLPYKQHNYALPLNFLFASRTDKSKGIDIIVEAFKQIPESSAVLHIAGSGYYDAILKNINKKNIIYYGFLKDTVPLYEKCDIFILLSKIENCSLSILDALNQSIPVITTNVGGNPELINDKNGFIVKRSVESLIKCIEYITSNINLLTELSKNANSTAIIFFNKSDTVKKIKNEIRSLNVNSF